MPSRKERSALHQRLENARIAAVAGPQIDEACRDIGKLVKARGEALAGRELTPKEEAEMIAVRRLESTDGKHLGFLMAWMPTKRMVLKVDGPRIEKKDGEFRVTWSHEEIDAPMPTQVESPKA